MSSALGTQPTVEALEAINTCSAEDTQEARENVDDVVYDLSLTHSFLATVLMNKLRIVMTTAVPTWAVTVLNDGFAGMLVNPEFTLQMKREPNTPKNQALFVAAHEVMHLKNLHLYGDRFDGDEAWTIACEATINNYLMRVLNRGLPVIDGETTGVDPDKIYKRYRKDLRDRGLTPKDKDEFFATDLGCYSELKRMSKPAAPRGQSNHCNHQPGQGGGQGGQGQPCSCNQQGNQSGQQSGQGGGQSDQSDQSGQQGNQPGQGGGSGGTDPNCPQHGAASGAGVLDPEMVDEIMSNALSVAINAAKTGNNRHAKKELLELAGQSEGSEQASKVWGDLGLGQLRGETLKTRKTDYWYRWVENRLADKLVPGLRLQRQRRITWESRFRYNGDERQMTLAVYVDASGSMRQSDLDWIAQKVGDMDNLKVFWNSFDGDVWPFEAGEPFKGGGGTRFDIIEHHYQELEEEVDAVLVVTDGYASPIVPSEPDKWIWLITPGGTTWPKENSVCPMECYEIDTQRDGEFH